LGKKRSQDIQPNEKITLLIVIIKQKTAAIYDRWLSTLGGGEQVAFAYASCLRDLGYKTTLLTHQEVNEKKAQKKMDVDLDNIEIKYLPPHNSKEISKYTAEYDIFINTSYLDYFANHSRQGIMSVFFPGRIFISPFEYLKRALVIPSLRAFFIYPTRFENFEFDESIDGKIYKWLGDKSNILFNQNIKKFKITFFIENLSFALIDELQFSLSGKKINFSSRSLNHHLNTITFVFETNYTKNKKFTIISPREKDKEPIALIKLTIPGIRYFLYNFFKSFFPVWEMRLHGGPSVTKRADLESYHKMITISKFCQKWIRKYWLLPSEVLYPPVNTKKFVPAKIKKNHIIHIGRFFVVGHNKKQLDLIKIFKKLINKEGVKDWELHLIGSVHEGSAHQKYFEQVKFEAKNYPIFFHTDIPFTELKKRLSEAKIYWHATGLDENEEKNPILFEHFGVTTVEAMASGCTPVVISAGGQKEIITEGSGFLWKTREQLLEKTIKLIKNPKLIEKMSVIAIKRSSYFSRENFKKRFRKIVEK